jgi:hypothetical protein
MSNARACLSTARRRIHLVPFIITIPPKERDKNLFEKLKPEWPGILQWAVDGCLEWNEIGLAPPKAVRDASDEYFTEEDALARWIDEECVTGKTNGAPAPIYGDDGKPGPRPTTNGPVPGSPSRKGSMIAASPPAKANTCAAIPAST